MEVGTAKQRKRMITSTPVVHGTFNSFEKTDHSPIKIDDEPMKRIKINEKLIIEAVKAVGTRGKGASYQSIKKYIQAREDAPDVDLPRVKVTLKKAIMNCVENGVLKRPKRNESSIGATGHFMLVKGNPKKEIKENEKTSKDDKNSKTTKPDKAQKEKKVAAPIKQKKPLATEAKKVKETKVNTDAKKETKKETKVNTAAKKETKVATEAKKQTKVTTEAKKESKVKKETQEKHSKKTAKIAKKEKTPPINADEIAHKFQFSDSETDEKASKAIKKTKRTNLKTNIEENLEFADSENEEKSPEKTKKPEKSNSKKPKTKEKIPNTKSNKDVNKDKVNEDINEIEMITPEEKNTTKQLDLQISEPAKTMPKVTQNKKGAAKPGMRMKRKDLSDTELNVTHHAPIPLKSYSSDTELEVSRKIEAKTRKVAKVKGDNINLKTRNNSQLKKDNSSSSQNQTRSRKK